MAFKEKRREKRFSVDMTCEVKGHEDFKMRVLDISRGGIAIWGDAMIGDAGPIDIKVDIGGACYNITAIILNVIKSNGKVRYGMQIVKSTEDWDELIYCHMIKSL